MSQTVPQFMLIHDIEETVPVLHALIEQHIASRPDGYKVIVFFTTARLCGLMATLADRSGLPGVLEIHSRKSQTFRTRTSG